MFRISRVSIGGLSSFVHCQPALQTKSNNALFSRPWRSQDSSAELVSGRGRQPPPKHLDARPILRTHSTVEGIPRTRGNLKNGLVRRREYARRHLESHRTL